MGFIVFDGLDASGKSTQAFKLYTFLKSQGKTVYWRVHPSNDNIFGIQAKRFLNSHGKSAHFLAALFYILDVLRSITLFSWRHSDYLIFVRYLMGTAYLPAPLHRIAYSFFATLIPTPTHMFFLDVSPNEAYRRIQMRKTQEMFETLDKLKQVRQKAQFLATINNWVIIDADKPEKDIAKEIRAHL